jgi:hypothetical protein
MVGDSLFTWLGLGLGLLLVLGLCGALMLTACALRPALGPFYGALRSVAARLAGPVLAVLEPCRAALVGVCRGCVDELVVRPGGRLGLVQVATESLLVAAATGVCILVDYDFVSARLAALGGSEGSSFSVDVGAVLIGLFFLAALCIGITVLYDVLGKDERAVFYAGGPRRRLMRWCAPATLLLVVLAAVLLVLVSTEAQFAPADAPPDVKLLGSFWICCVLAGLGAVACGHVALFRALQLAVLAVLALLTLGVLLTQYAVAYAQKALDGALILLGAALTVPAELGTALTRQHHKWVARIARPQFQRTPAPPASVVPPTPVVSPGAPQSAPPNGKTPNGAAPSNPSLGPVCARCGGSLSATARFCGQCGAGPLSSSNPPNPGASAKAYAP